MRSVLLHGALTLLIVSGALLAYDRHVVRPGLRVGVVDIAQIYQDKEAQLLHLMAAGATEDERRRAAVLARSFAQRLPAALSELARECRCVVVSKSAVAAPAPGSVDLTSSLKNKMEQP